MKINEILDSRLQVNRSHDVMPSMFDPISSHIPLKLKEKAWKGDFIHYKCCCGPDALLCEVTSRAACVDAELLLVLSSLYLSGDDAFTFLGFLEADFLGVSPAGGLRCLFGGRMLSILVGWRRIFFDAR
jgi:hypothetical protein